MISVLVIDGNPDFLKATGDYLSSGNGIEIRTSTSADNAVKMLNRHLSDVIVASNLLPDADGIALLERLREQGYEMPVILYARHAKEKTIIDAMRHGAEFFLQLSDDPKPQFLELRSLIEEIIRRRQTEEALRRTVEDLRTIVTKNEDAMIVLDKRGYVRFANPAAESLFNINESELIGKLFGFPILLSEPVEMFILREFRKFVAVEMRMVEVQWRDQPSYLVSMRDITWHVQHEEELSQAKDRLEAEAVNRSRDLLDAYNSLRSEVTERKRTDLALRESERKYRQIVELANEGICMLDKKAVIRFVNPRMAEMLGYLPEEMIGKSIFDFMERDVIPQQKNILERHKQGIRESYDSEMIKKNGARVLMIINGAPVFDEDEKYAGSVSMYTDITERKMSEDELRDAKAQAELYLDLMGHDIRNLAQIAIGYIELALETDDPDEIKDLLVKPLESLQDTAQIIDNVRKLQSTSHANEEIAPVNLCQILTDLKSRYTVSSTRQVDINLKTVPDCTVIANALVTDVFTNLINNSIKHSDPEKPLIIDIRIDRVSENDVDYLRCIVDDNGPGISNWVKDKIFMRFQRGDTKAHGKGLGLHIAKTLVEDYGGKIWVEDRVPGDYTQGARFVVVLPVA
jgi:PAS domain S-box-containing protein